MRSSKHHTTSKSGASRKSTKKPASSSQTANSSRTAPASFEQVFGKPPPEEAKNLILLLEAARARHAQLLAKPVPTLALYRVQHQQALRRHERRIRDIQQALASLDTANAKA